MDEFTTWMRLVAFIEGLQLAPPLINALGEFFERDVRRSLHFLEANLPVSDAKTETLWRWQHNNGDEGEEDKASLVDIPAWTVWSTGSSSFDALTSNLLVELAAGEAEGKNPEDKTSEEKQADIDAMSELAQIMDSASVADTWMTPAGLDSDEIEDSFFLCERERLAALELRRSSLYMLGSPTSSLGASLMRSQGPSASECVQRTLDSALETTRRCLHQTALAQLKSKFELPLAYKGCVLDLTSSAVIHLMLVCVWCSCGNSEPQFTLDYMPMVGRLLSGTGLQEGRRRTSRRNHYLGDVLGDMTVIDELPAFNTYLQLDEDQIVAASPASTQ
ncbi:hypothetical protein GQ600_2679 [Phytophthora cactorum]|nr:hypothetical protein GQ600_2679 [Phytophthora cactorum]